MKTLLHTCKSAAATAFVMAAVASCGDNHDCTPTADSNFSFEPSVEASAVVPPGTITTANIRNFRVSAFNSSNPHDLIMRNIEVVRKGLNSWTYSPSIDWPDYPIDFEAVTPSSVEIASFGSWNWGYPSTVDFDTNQEGKTDFCIAVARHIHQTEGRIRLNFRHAMARIDILLGADIPDATLMVKKIDLFNVCRRSTFLFPKESTYPQNQTGQLDGCWADWTQSNANDTIAFFISNEPLGTPVDTSVTSIGNQDNIFYIPYTFIPLIENNGYITGSGIRILCKTISDDTGKQIWPNENTPYQLVPSQWGGKWAYIFFPLADSDKPADSDRNKWRPGYHYNYRIHIHHEGTLPPSPNQKPAPAAARSSGSVSNSLEVISHPYP